MAIRKSCSLVIVLGLIVGLLGAGCGGGGGGRSAESVLEALLRVIRQGSLDDVMRGTTPGIDDAFRGKSSTLDEAFSVAAFKSAAADARSTADTEVRSQVATLFSDLDAIAQRKVEAKFRSMLCEARLYAQNQQVMFSCSRDGSMRSSKASTSC